MYQISILALDQTTGENGMGIPPSQWLVTGMSPGANVLLGTTVDKDLDLGQTPERPML